MKASPSDRRYDIDWLRIFATYLLLLFHTAMVFNPAPFYHIRNVDQSMFFLILTGFIGLWHMPLFFLLAGWSAHASLQKRGTPSFLRERFFRLLIPLAAGCILLMPPIKFLELSNGFDANFGGLSVNPVLQGDFREVIPSGLPAMASFDQSFLRFLPTFFTDPMRFTWAHLWFVAYLLTFTVLYLPIFVWIGRSSRDLRQNLSGLWIYAPVIPLAVVQVMMRPHWPGLQNLIDDWANFAYYTIFLVCGFLLAHFPVLEAVVQRERQRALAIAVAATVVLFLGVVGIVSSQSIILAHTAIAGWCFVIAMLGWARIRFSRAGRGLSYLRESAFPVYLLHQSAIVIPGYFLIQLPLSLWVKFALLLAISVAFTMSAYHFLVRPNAIPRFLCGMKANRRPQGTGRQRPAARAAGAATTAALALLLASDVLSSAVADTIADVNPIGTWYAEGGAAKVELRNCGGELCGRIVWLRAPFDEHGCELQDRNNPQVSERSRPLIGLEILAGLVRDDESARHWSGGEIYDPSSGNTYRATLTMIDQSRLEVRGYLGIPLLGRSTRWFRVGTEGEACNQLDRADLPSSERIVAHR
jgi:uncharacterized protein (DUF2147 family)